MAKNLNKIWEMAPTDILDYSFLMEFFKGSSQPKLIISYLIKKGYLIRVKKGLYILGGPYSRGLYWPEVLANLIYGPSYLSLEYALSHYGLIPERVIEVTSMTCNRNKRFNTPVGRFSYSYLHPRRYAIGINFQPLFDHPKEGGFLIAIPEKALADCVAQHPELKTKDALVDYVFGLRIEEEELKKMDSKKMKEIALIYKNRQVNFLNELLADYHHDQ